MVEDLVRVHTTDTHQTTEHQEMADVVVDQVGIVMVVIEAVVRVIRDPMVEVQDHNITQVVVEVPALLEQVQQTDLTEVPVD
jgi:hypothetical protein